MAPSKQHLFFTSYLKLILFVIVVTAVSSTVSQHLHPDPDPDSDTGSVGSRVSESLKFIVVVSRHGNRGLTDYPLDPYPVDDPQYWPYGSKELTPKGRVQMYELGRKVRSLYNGFLNTTFYSEELYATSTDTDRTLMSGEVFLAGLYHPKGFQVWDQNVLWQPAPLRSTSPDNTENVLDCAKFVEEVEEVAETFLEEYAEYISDMIGYFNDVTGLNATGLTAVEYLYHLGDKLAAEELEGYALPRWTRVLFPSPLQYLVGKIYLNLYAGTDDNARLMMGSLLGDVLDSMTGKLNGTLSDQRRIHYYSGYDASIVALQVVLGISRDSVVDLVNPGSALILELHQHSSSGQPNVQALIVKGSTDEMEIQKLKIPNCGSPCDFYTLVNNSQNFTNVDFESECSSSTFSLTALAESKIKLNRFFG